MKYQKKHNINLQEVHEKNLSGLSMVDLSKEYNIPKSSLLRYMHNAGYKVQFNRPDQKHHWFISKTDKDPDHDYGWKNTTPWKQALIFHLGHKCFICEYDKIIDCHHIIPISNGGKTNLRNGILLCPNCHAEVHAGIIDLTEALLKLGELLENSIKNNQQPSHISKHEEVSSDMEGSTTNSRAKAVMETRAPKSQQGKRFGKKSMLKGFLFYEIRYSLNCI